MNQRGTAGRVHRLTSHAPRALCVDPVGPTYGIVFGSQLYAAACSSPPAALSRCRKATQFFCKCNASPEDLRSSDKEDSWARPGQLLVEELVREGWSRYAGAPDRWLPKDADLEPLPWQKQTASVPPGWEVLTWQQCQGGVLKALVAFHWHADCVVVEDPVHQRFLRIGSSRSNRPGAVIGDAKVRTGPEGKVEVEGDDVLLITRPLLELRVGEELFDLLALVHDSDYAAASVADGAARTEDPAKLLLEASGQSLFAELWAWFSPEPVDPAVTLATSVSEAAALRSRLARTLRCEHRRHLQQALSDYAPLPDSEDEDCFIGQQPETSWEEDPDSTQVWVQVALGSVLELASCIPQGTGPRAVAFERLLARATKTLAQVAPLSLPTGSTARSAVMQTADTIEELLEMFSELKPAAIELLLTLATATGFSGLIAQALKLLLADDDEDIDRKTAARCCESLQRFWQLGSAAHFARQKALEIGDRRGDGRPEQFQFVHVSQCGSCSGLRLRSHRTASLEDPGFAKGIYWEVRVSNPATVSLGVWLESKKKFAGIQLSDGTAAGQGLEAVPEASLPPVRRGSVFGLLATTEALTITCDGRPFSSLQYEKLFVLGERIAVFVERATCSALDINIGQERFQHLPAEDQGHSPVPWASACDPFSSQPLKAFESKPETQADVAKILMDIMERNISRLVGGGDHSVPVQHVFAASEQMTITEEGTVVSNVRENAWARVDSEITVGVSVEFTFEVLDDRENDEGTCYGIATSDCTKYDGRGAFVVRGYSGHLYCDGADKGEKFPKIHPRGRVSFRVDYSEGRIEAWLDDQEPRLLLNDVGALAGRSFYPVIFNYHGTRTRVRLLRCSSGWRSGSNQRDAFALDASAAAASRWLLVLDKYLEMIRTGPGDAPNRGYAQPGRGIATALQVLLATVQTASRPELHSSYEHLADVIRFIVIDRAEDGSLRQAQEAALELISALGVGAVFGGPEDTLEVFLSIWQPGATTITAPLGNRLASYLLGIKRPVLLPPAGAEAMATLALRDPLGGRVFLRLALNAFAAGAGKFFDSVACILEQIGAIREGGDKQVAASWLLQPCFTQLLPVLSQLLAVLPGREQTSLPSLVQFLSPVCAVLETARWLSTEAPVRLLPLLRACNEGLQAFLAGVAGLLMAQNPFQEFPLDLGHRDVWDNASGAAIDDPLLTKVKDSLEEAIGAFEISPQESQAPPEVILEILSGRGRGGSLVAELLTTSRFKSPTASASPLLIASFAAALLGGGSAAIEEAAEDPSASSAAMYWRQAENFVQKKVRPAKQAIAAEEGDAAAFEAALAARLTWLVRHVVWSSQVAPPPAELSRASTSPTRRPKVAQETDGQLRWPLSPPGKAARQRLKELHRAGSGDHDSSETEEGSHLLSGVQLQLLAQLCDEYSKGKGKDSQQDGARSDATVSRVSFEESVRSQRQLATRKQLGLRLLRHLAKKASEAQDLDLLLPSLQEALESTLTSPLRGIAQSGIGARRAVLDELSLLLREVVAACTTEVSRPLGLSFLCLPLPKADMEGVLGSLLSGLPALALDCQQGPAQLLTARVASLVLRVYLDGPGSGSSVEAAILNQVEALLEQISNAEGQVRFPMVSSMTEPLEVDWDLGAFGRLRSRKLDMSSVKEMAAAVTGEDAGEGEVQNLSLSKLRELQASGEISDVAFCAMLLRLSQAEAGRGLNDGSVDAVEFQHAMCLARGQSSPWTSSLGAGVCAAALSFLRRGVSKAGEAPAMAEKLIQVASRSTSFVSTLAINLYFKLQLPDDKVAAHVPQFLALLGEADAATEGLSSARRPGCLAMASCLSLELAKRASAVIPTVRRLLADAAGRSEDATVRSALRVLGGVRRCSSYHMQAVSTGSGAAIVVGADERSAVLLTPQGDVKMLTRLPWSSLEGHCGTWPTEWQDDEILALLRQSLQQRLSEGVADAAAGPPLELLRATASALHGSGCWDASLLAEVVRALDRLAPSNKRSPSSCFVELAEHRCLLLRLSMAMAGTANQEIEPRRSHLVSKTAPPSTVPCNSSSSGEEAPSLLSVLNQSSDWRGRYKLKRHTDTWFKAKWQIQFNLNFSETGSLYVTVRWPKFAQPAVARLGRWYKDTGGRGGIAITFDVELPEGRREGGRTRDGQVFSWQGQLVCSRGCPHFEGTARSRVSDLSYEWYVVPPEPVALLKAQALDLFGEPDEALMRPYSLLSFNIGFSGPKMEHFARALRLPTAEGGKEPTSPRKLAAAAVANMHQYGFVFGPPSVGKVSRQAAEEETFSLCQSGERHEGQAPAGEGDSGPLCSSQGWESMAASQARWCTSSEVLSLIGGEQDIPEGSSDEVVSAEPSLPPQERSPTTRPAAASGDTTERSVRSRLTESPGARSTRSFPLLVPPPLRRARVTDRGPYPVRATPTQSREGDAQKNETGQEESARQVRHQALSAALELEEIQLRYAILMRILEDLLAYRPPEVCVDSCFQAASEREAFLYRALQLPNSERVLARLTEDFASSEAMVRSALVVACSGLVAPFASQGSSITVDTDHEYHPNEDWEFCLRLPGASRMTLKFDARSRTEAGRDFVQFFGHRDPDTGTFSKRLHLEEKLCGCYPAGFPDVLVPGDHVWMRFQSDSSEQAWGVRFTLSGDGDGVSNSAVPFPCARSLLLATVSAVKERPEALSVRLLAASVLLAVAAAQPQSSEAALVCEALVTLLPEPAAWSTEAWGSVLELFSVSERFGQRAQLASLAQLISSQLGHQTLPLLDAVSADAAAAAPKRMALDKVRPIGAGILLNGQATMVATQDNGAAFGLGSPFLLKPALVSPGTRGEPRASSVAALCFSLHIEVSAEPAKHDESTEQAPCGVGLVDAVAQDADEVGFSDSDFLAAQALPLTAGSAVVEVQMKPDAASGNYELALLVSISDRCFSVPLKRNPALGTMLRPVIWIRGRNKSVTIGEVSANGFEQVSCRLMQLRQAMTLLQPGDSPSSELPVQTSPWLVVRAWARQESAKVTAKSLGDADEDTSDQETAIKEVLQSHLTHMVRSCSSPGLFVARGCEAGAAQLLPRRTEAIKLEVPGASALEVSWSSIAPKEGARFCLTLDREGHLPVARESGPPHQRPRNAVVFGKWLFATLDDTDPDLREPGHQEAWLLLSPGWELVQNQAEVVPEVVAKYFWGTGALVLGNGNAFYTKAEAGRAGQCVGKDKLLWRRCSSSKCQYRPKGISARVLIRRLLEPCESPGAMHHAEEMAPCGKLVVPAGVAFLQTSRLPQGRWAVPKEVEIPQEATSGATCSEVHPGDAEGSGSHPAGRSLPALSVDGPHLRWTGGPLLPATAERPEALRGTRIHSLQAFRELEDVFFAGLHVLQLEPTGSNSGTGSLTIGFGPWQQKEQEAQLDSSSLLLWKNDGQIIHPCIGSQQSRLWAFREGDQVGFAIGSHQVSLLRNGVCVHNINLLGLDRLGFPSGAKIQPVLIVGLESPATLRLGEQLEHPQLWLDPGFRMPEKVTSVANGFLPPAAPRQKLRRCFLAISVLTSLQKKCFEGVASLGPEPLPSPWEVLPESEAPAPLPPPHCAPLAAHPEVREVGGVALTAAIGQLGGACTVEAWVRLRDEDLQRCVVVANFEIAQGGSEASGSSSRSVPSLAIRNGHAEAFGGELQSEVRLNSGCWHHVACSASSDERRLWLDYQLLAQVGPSESAISADLRADVGFYEGASQAELCQETRSQGRCTEIRNLRIWKEDLGPVALEAYDAFVEDQAVELLSETIASSKWRGASVLGPALDERLGPRGLRALDRRNAKAAMRRLLRSVASKLCVRGQDLQRGYSQRTAASDALLGREVMAFLCLTGQQSCWQVQVKAAEFGEDMPERLSDPGYLRFRRQVHLADTLFASCADETILELVDSQMLRDGSEGSHDECWTKMPRISLWPSLPVARAVEPIRALIGELSLNQKLTYILGRSLAQEVPWDDILPDSILELCRSQLRQLWEDLLESSKIAFRVDMDALADLAEKISACACFKPDGVLETVVEELFLATIADLMYFRFAILLDVNWLVRNSLQPFVDLAPSPQTALDRLLRQQKPRLLGHLKYARFQQVLKQTRFDGSSPTITLNRKLALSMKEHDRVDWDLRRSLTGQFLNEIRRLSLGPKLFRRPWLTRAVKVQFKGEGGEDAGGLYREALEACVRELTSRSLPLLLPCPNAVAEVGENRDCWILNPSATSSTALAGLEFMGQLMGLALRTGDLLPCALAPFTFKGLVEEERTLEDLRGIDVFAARQVERYREEGGDEDDDSLDNDDGVETGDGSSRADRLLKRRLKFDSLQLAAVRRGLASVVPIHLLRLWRWQDLRRRVCGNVIVDLECLKQHTVYKNCTETDIHIVHLWQVLEGFSQQQRRSFLRFVWGRSSLPSEVWERSFTVQLLSGSNDLRLPSSHTCFFTLDLPAYSSVEICRERLLYCMSHCVTIDTDGAAARSMNWDEDEEELT